MSQCNVQDNVAFLWHHQTSQLVAQSRSALSWQPFCTPSCGVMGHDATQARGRAEIACLHPAGLELWNVPSWILLVLFQLHLSPEPFSDVNAWQTACMSRRQRLLTVCFLYSLGQVVSWLQGSVWVIAVIRLWFWIVRCPSASVVDKLPDVLLKITYIWNLYPHTVLLPFYVNVGNVDTSQTCAKAT